MRLLLTAGLIGCALAAHVPAQAPSWRAQYISADAPVIALVNARVIDGTGAAPVDGQTVLIRDGRIEAVGPSVPVLVVDGNPSVDIADLARVHLVFKDGDGYDPRQLRAAARGLVGWH